MGAVVGALTRGKGLTPKLLAPATGKSAQRLSAPSIRDVDFFETHFVVLGNQGFNIEWREEAALAFVGNTQSEDYAEWEDETALSLHYEEDGLVFEESLTVGYLSALRWNDAKEAFVAPDGSPVVFFQNQKFKPPVAPKPAQLPQLSEKVLYRLPSFEGDGVYDLFFLVPVDKLDHVRNGIDTWLESRREQYAAVQQQGADSPEEGDWTSEDVVQKMTELGATYLSNQETGPVWD